MTLALRSMTSTTLASLFPAIPTMAILASARWCNKQPGRERVRLRHGHALLSRSASGAYLWVGARS